MERNARFYLVTNSIAILSLVWHFCRHQARRQEWHESIGVIINSVYSIIIWTLVLNYYKALERDIRKSLLYYQSFFILIVVQVGRNIV